MSSTRHRTPPGRRFVRFLRIAAVNLLLLLFLLAGLEIGLRIFPVVSIQWVEGNEETGFAIPAHYEEYLDYPEHPDGHFIYRSNNLGFREDRPTRVEKSDSIRIVVLGDSHTDGVCWNRESYPNRLEHYLNESGCGRCFEVINAGTGKYSPFQYWRAFRYRIRPLAPDVVIVGFYIGNDFFDMFRRDDRPSCAVDAQGRIVELPPRFYFYTKPGFTDTWLARSYTYYLLFGSRFLKNISYQATRALIMYRNLSSLEGVSSRQVLRYFYRLRRLSQMHRQATTQSLAQLAFFRAFPRKKEEAFRLVEYVLDKFRRQQDELGFRLIVLPIPTKFEIEPERAAAALRGDPQERHELIPGDPGAFDDSLYDDLLDLLQRMDIEHLDIRPVLREAAGTEKLYYQTDFHLNPVANDLVGRALGEFLLGSSEPGK